MKSIICTLLGLCLMLGAGQALAADVVVVDSAKVFAESAPGKAGAKHLQDVQKVLQKGLDDLQAMYQGKEESKEAQQDILKGYQALQQQMAVEQQAVAQVLDKLLLEEVQKWRAKNKDKVVLNKQITLDADPKADITQTILTEMNKRTAKFADLPTVQLNQPADAKKK